jgi:hypothetical protein
MEGLEAMNANMSDETTPGAGVETEDSFERPIWPNVPRICFGPGEPQHLNACVGWVMSGSDRLGMFASGYREAARGLYRSTLESSMELDCVVFPIAFLWRHHVEIMLKDIIARGRRLDDADPEFPTHHDLPKLWALARPYIEDTGPADSPEVGNVESNIVELNRIDSGSFSFRYPSKKDDSASLPSNLDYVNLRVLHEAMEAVSNLLEGVASVLSERQDYVWQAKADAEYDR